MQYETSRISIHILRKYTCTAYTYSITKYLPNKFQSNMQMKSGQTPSKIYINMIKLDWKFMNITRNVHFIKNEHNSKNLILFHPSQIKIIFSITAVSTRHFWLEMHCKEHFNSTLGNIIYSHMQNFTALISYINNYKNLVHFKMLKILNFNFALLMLLTVQQIPNHYGFSIKATQCNFVFSSQIIKGKIT